MASNLLALSHNTASIFLGLVLFSSLLSYPESRLVKRKKKQFCIPLWEEEGSSGNTKNYCNASTKTFTPDKKPGAKGNCFSPSKRFHSNPHFVSTESRLIQEIFFQTRIHLQLRKRAEKRFEHAGEGRPRE